MTRILRDVTAGRPGRLTKPIVFTAIANLLGIIPAALGVQAALMIFAVAGGAAPEFGRFWGLCAGLFAWLFMMYAAEVPAYRSCYRDAYAVSAEGREELAEKLRKLPLGYFSRRDPGDLVNMLMSDFSLIETGISHLLPQMTGAILLPFVAFAGLAFWNLPMAAAMFAPLPLAALVLVVSTKLQNRLSRRHMKAKVEAGNRLQEYLNGIRVAKAYNLTGERFERMEAAFRRFMKESMTLEATLGPFAIMAIGLIRLGLTFMVVTGVYLLANGRLDIPTFVAFLIIGTRIYDPLSASLLLFFEFRYNALAGRRIADLMEEPEMGGAGSTPARHDIEARRVDFSYGTESVLRDVGLKLKEGELTALVGPSGCGKTTLMKLLARFYDPQEGAVLFGGQDERSLDPEKLMERISFVFQDVYLFKDTVRNNIAFGREGATDAEIEDAAKRACAHSFIMKLPQGYETLIGEGGSTLSGGEKQRISIARALLKDAPVVLLDEATASLDPENEAEVQRAIDALVEGRTVAVIAHKLRTIEGADNIAVMEAGQIVEQGRHEALLEKEGLYARMWRIQNTMSGWTLAD